MIIWNSKTLISDSKFDHNFGDTGGAIFNYCLHDCGTEIKDSLFDNNSALKAGGAIFYLGN